MLRFAKNKEAFLLKGTHKMAHAIRPNHKPHDQLRMEAPSQKVHSDKYVSAFTTGSATVDMTFRNAILPKSADHFKVGIDELTVNLGNLSMLEYGAEDVLFRVLRRGNNLGENQPNFRMIDGPVGNEEQWRDAFEFKVDRPYLTILEVLERCTEIATAVGTFMREEGLVQPGGGAANNLWTLNLPAGAGNFEHFRVSVTANGQIKFSGNRMFWANFTIEVPHEKYRMIMFKDVEKRYISLHPGTGNEIATPYTDGWSYSRRCGSRAGLGRELRGPCDCGGFGICRQREPTEHAGQARYD